MTPNEWEEVLTEAKAMREMAGMDPLPRMSCSFSGGRTSAVMTKRLWEECKDTHEIRIAFANTGCEDTRTLDFIHACEVNFGWPIVWLEAVVDPRKGYGVRHRVVDYETADRSGKVFEEVVAKYGIFNQTKKSCTARLKEDVFNSYLRSIGWEFGKKLSHKTAVGIRADEIDRRSFGAVKNLGVFYPMIEWGMTKRDVAMEIKTWPFDLQIPGDHWGNCKWCWKKTDRKLYTLALEDASVFDVPSYLEEKYGHLDFAAGRKNCDSDGRAYFFRGHRSAKDIVREAHEKEFQPYSDDPYQHAHDHELDTGGACGESCEPWADIDEYERD